MAEEVKTTKTRAKKTEETQMFTKEEVQRLINEAVQNALKQNSTPTIVNVAQNEYVGLLFLGTIAPGTSVGLGKLGKINRPGTILDVPKKEFIQSLGVPVIDYLLQKRSLIVVSGLTDDERERFGLAYKEDELLTQKMFFNLFSYSDDEICKIFKNVCPQHKRIIATMYISEYFDNHNNKINMTTVKKLNQMSKEVYKDGLFTPILKSMGQKIAFEEED